MDDIATGVLPLLPLGTDRCRMRRGAVDRALPAVTFRAKVAPTAFGK